MISNRDVTQARFVCVLLSSAGQRVSMRFSVGFQGVSRRELNAECAPVARPETVAEKAAAPPGPPVPMIPHSNKYPAEKFVARINN